MIIMKNFVKVFVILLFVLVGFTGCAKVEQFFIVTPKGEIQSGLNVDIDVEAVNKAHNDTKYSEKPSPNSVDLIGFIVTQMLFQKMHIDEVLTSVDEHLRPKYSITITCNGFDYDIVDLRTVNNAKILISFNSYEDYLKGQALLNPDDGSEDDKKEGEDFWTKTLFTYTHHIYSNSSFRATLMLEGENSITTVLKEAFPTFDVEKDMTFVQVYATQDAKLRSNATKKYSQNGVYYHMWNYNSAQVETPNAIKMYYVYPNSQGWYLLTLGLTGMFVIFYVLYIFYKTPLKNKPKKFEDYLDLANKKTDK